MTLRSMMARHAQRVFYNVGQFARWIRYGGKLTWEKAPLTWAGEQLLYTCELAAVLDPPEYQVTEELVHGERVVRIQATPPQGWPDPKAGHVATIDGREHRVTKHTPLEGDVEHELLLRLGSAA